MNKGGFGVDIPHDRIIAFCQHWEVRELALFGSVLNERFSSDSDIDILISFSDQAQWSLYEMMDMREELEKILGRKVDLVEKEALKNPFRRQAILSERQVIYAA